VAILRAIPGSRVFPRRPVVPARLRLLALLLLAVAGLTACFNPAQPGCAFSCATDGLCPSGYSCGSDLVCHRDDGQGSCAISVDAAAGDAAGDATGGQ
jgi:hypothetical protein